MSAAGTPEPLFSYAVVRGWLTHAVEVLNQPERTTCGHWEAHTLARFAAWAAAVEGFVELIPEILRFVPIVVRRNAPDTYTDYQGALSALEKLIVDADPPDALFAHGSARVRHVLACPSKYCKRLENDPDPVVRSQARYRHSDDPTLPWWAGVLPEKPPDQPEVLRFGALVVHMQYPNDWNKAGEVAEAFSALPRELSGRIARRFLTPLWGGSTWAKPVWKALLQAPLPLAERRLVAEQAIGDLLLPYGLPREHYEAIEFAISGYPQEEQRELVSLLALSRARLEPPPEREEHALWAARPRRRPSASQAHSSEATVPPSELFPQGLFERLAHEIVHPGLWGEDRFALHPRARWELGRGLKVVDGGVATIQNTEATFLDMADLAALARKERPHIFDATQLALIGLLGVLDETDPIFATLANHSESMLREAAALGLAGTGAPLARKLLDDAVPEVWTAARIAIPDAEPWRGPLAEDPFAGCSAEEAEALAPKLVELSHALPRVRSRALELADFVRLARIAAALPAPHGLTLAFRLLPERDLERRRAPLAIMILSAEGGLTAWAVEIERRLKRARGDALWLGKYLIEAAAEGDFPAGGGAPILWNRERRWAAARDALGRHERTLQKDAEVAEMWLATAALLWPDDQDPLPLPGPWRKALSDNWVRMRLEQMRFGPDWPVTQAFLEGARSGFPEPWAWWSDLEDLIVRMPETAQMEAALEGFWRDGDFGNWSRALLSKQFSRTRTVDQNALHALLADPRLALERLMQRDRTKHTLFVRRMRLAAGIADFAEGLSTLTAIATQDEVEPWTAGEIHGWRPRFMDAIRQAMAVGPGGPRGVFVTLAPPGLWEPMDRAFVHSVAHDATPEEAQAIARRLAACGDAEDLPIVRELFERHPAVAPWPELLEALAARRE